MAAQALTSVYGIQITDHPSLNANTFDPASSITNVTFYTHGVARGELASPPYRQGWSNVPVGIYLVSARATMSGGLTPTSATAVVLVDNGGAPALTITPLGQGSNAITGQDILGRTYQVQSVTDPQATNWQTLGTATADSSGAFQFIDSNAAPQQFYRTLYP